MKKRMRMMRTRILSLMLAIALVGMIVPETAFAEETVVSSEEETTDETETVSETQEEASDETDEAQTEEAEDTDISAEEEAEEEAEDSPDEEEADDAETQTQTYEYSVTVDEDGEEVLEEDTVSDEALADAQDAETYTDQTTYSLSLTVSTAAVSSSNSALKTISVSVPKITTTVTRVSASGSQVLSQTTTSYALTLKVHVRNSGWKTASLNSAGTAYTYTASKASSGYYLQAVRIGPSSAFLSALNAAGLSYVYRADTKYWDDLGWATPGLTAGSTGNSNPMTGLELEVISASDADDYDQTDRYIMKQSATYRTRFTGKSSWNSVKKNGSTSGKKSASASIGSLKAKVTVANSDFALSGSIQYSVRSTISDSSSNWSSYKSNYSTAGSKNKKIQAVRIQLTGELAERFDVYYRVYTGHYGWLDWAKNGEKAGSKGIGITVAAIQIKLVPKGASAPGDTSDHYISSISGDSTLDGYLTKIYKKKGTNLKTLFNYVASYTYKRYYSWPTQSNWKSWSITYAKQMYKNQKGNCYRYASLFCWLARGLGYNAKVVVGYVPSRSSGWAPHGWVEIKLSGKTYIYDPDLKHDYWSLNWYKRTYSNAPVTYKKDSSSSYPN